MGFQHYRTRKGITICKPVEWKALVSGYSSCHSLRDGAMESSNPALFGVMVRQVRVKLTSRRHYLSFISQN
jgi:hypothetical protein